jgi:hypothetical protein
VKGFDYLKTLSAESIVAEEEKTAVNAEEGIEATPTPLPEARGGVKEAWKLALIEMVKKEYYEVRKYTYGNTTLDGKVRLDTSKGTVYERQGWQTIVSFPLVFEGEVYQEGSTRKVNPKLYIKKLFNDMYYRESIMKMFEHRLRFNFSAADDLPLDSSEVRFLPFDVHLNETATGEFVLEFNVTRPVYHNFYPNQQVSEGRELLEAKGGIREAWLQYFRSDAAIKNWKYTFKSFKFYSRNTAGYLWASGTMRIKEICICPTDYGTDFLEFIWEFENMQVFDLQKTTPITQEQLEDLCFNLDQPQTGSKRVLESFCKIPSIKKMIADLQREEYFLLFTHVEFGKEGQWMFAVNFSREMEANNVYPPTAQHEARELLEARGGVGEAWKIAIAEKMQQERYSIKREDGGVDVKGEIAIDGGRGEILNTADGNVLVSFPFVFQGEVRGNVGNFSDQSYINKSLEIMAKSIREYFRKIFIKGFPEIYNIPQYTTERKLLPLYSEVFFDTQKRELVFQVNITRVVYHNFYPGQSYSVEESTLAHLDEARGGVGEAWVQYLKQDTEIKKWRKKVTLYGKSAKAITFKIQDIKYVPAIKPYVEQIIFSIEVESAVRVDPKTGHEALLSTREATNIALSLYGSTEEERVRMSVTEIPVVRRLVQASEYGRLICNSAGTAPIPFKFACVLNKMVAQNIYPPNMSEGFAGEAFPAPLLEVRGGVAEAWRRVILSREKEYRMPVSGTVQNSYTLRGAFVINVNDAHIINREEYGVDYTFLLIPIHFVGEITLLDTSITKAQVIQESMYSSNFLADGLIKLLPDLSSLYVQYNKEERVGLMVTYDGTLQKDDDGMPQLIARVNLTIPVRKGIYPS